MGQSTISMAMFNCFLYVHQSVTKWQFIDYAEKFGYFAIVQFLLSFLSFPLTSQISNFFMSTLDEKKTKGCLIGGVPFGELT